MSDSVEISEVSGRCLCGNISFTAKTAGGHVGACHCSMCRTWSGGILLALEDATDLAVTGADNLGVYKSSEWGERCFCKTCGSNLFWRSPSLGHTAVMVGALQDTAGLTLAKQIFVDSKPGYYDFANPTENYTEAEFLALMAGANEHNGS
ncbi:MAG: hypothetical protein RLZ98_2468 [Pseudomonadota bacterium]|jgi:hypothetical protein